MSPDYHSDFWADHDENCHGIIDSDFCRKEYPEGFIWSCCGEIGTHPGCKSSQHESDPARSKRRQHDMLAKSNSLAEYIDNEDDEDEEEEEEEDE